MATLSRRSFGQTFKAERANRAPRRPRTPLLTRVAKLAAHTLPSWSALRMFVLTVAGLGLLTGAAWTVCLALGLAAAGVSLLLLEWLLSGGNQ